MECLACHTPNIDGARFCAKCGAPLPMQKAADADPLIGVTIGGRYRVTGILGEGGMGRVYTAEQQMGTSVRKVAVKTLLSQFAKDPGTVARFMREVGTVSELEHPNTIKVFDFGQIEGSGELYIAMEMLQGKSLDDALGDALRVGQAIAPERVDRIIGQVCGSLQEAHDKGIVHRDLKPANIFLITRAGEEDVVKVLDFGIAKRDAKDTKMEQKLTQQGTILGTPPYMSPEQFTGKELDPRSDVYSLGIVAYEMLTGRLPFEADTPWQWMTQHMSAQPAPFESIPVAANVPQKMRQAVLRALAKEPGQRPQSAREFFDELTLGGMRMSAVGLGSAGVGGIPPAVVGAAGTGVMQAPQAPMARGASTQIGEPMFPEAGRAATAKTIGAFDASPGMTEGPAPPALGHAYPMPTAPHQHKKKGGSSGLVLALVGVLFVGAGIGGFLYWRSTQTDDGTAEETPSSKSATASATASSVASSRPEASTKASASASVASASVSSASASASSASASATQASASASATTTTTSSSTATATQTHTTPTASASSSSGPQKGIDACCARQRDATKKSLCNRINSGIKSGRLKRDAALGTLRGQGINCN